MTSSSCDSRSSRERRFIRRRVRLLVLTDHRFGAAERKPLRDEWKSHNKQLNTAGISWEPIHFLTVDKCSVRLYRATIPIEILTLDRGRFS